MRNILVIWKKELKDTIRDRRTLMSMIVLPMVLMPMLIVGMGKFVTYQIQKSEQQVVKVAVENAKSAPVLVDEIKHMGKIELQDSITDPAEEVRSGTVDAALIIPDDFQKSLDAQKPVDLTILVKSTASQSAVAASRVSAAITAFNNQILKIRFGTLKVNQSVLTGVKLVSQDLTTQKERGGFGLGFLLPLFIVMWAIVGGQYTAIDVSAGEKERKTLESLLLTPVNRTQIVFGKLLAVATAALTSVVVALGSLYFVIIKSGFSSALQSGTASGASPMGISLDFSIDLPAVALMLAVSLLLVFMFSAVLLSIAIFAKSYKEAQSYIGPAYLVVILPVVLLNSIPSYKPAMWLFAVPAVNAVSLFKEVLLGSYEFSHIILTFSSLIVFSFLAIWVASRIYNTEGVLFRD